MAQSAKGTLAELPGAKVDAQILSLLNDAQGKRYPLLLELVGQRRIDAQPALLQALDHSDQEVRSAAMIALGETVPLEGLTVLVSQVFAPRNTEDAAVAQRALHAASVGVPGREACATELASALDGAPAESKPVVLEILGSVGGTKALNTLAAAAKSENPELQDVGSRLLGKWNSVDAAPVLLDLAKTAPSEKYQVRALRGYIGLVRKFPMSAGMRAEMCQQAFELARPAEQKLVLDVLELHPSTETLKVAIKAMARRDQKQESAQVAHTGATFAAVVSFSHALFASAEFRNLD